MASCEQCTQGYVMKQDPEGTMVGNAYLHEGPDKSRAVVILTDVFGLPLVNCKILADGLSKKLSCDVWVPDMFAGHPPVTVDQLEPLLPDRAGVQMTFTSKIRFFFLVLTHLIGFLGVRASVLDPRVEEFITTLREEKGYQKIGAVGYCLGGSVTIRVASKGIVDSVVICHPGRCTIEQIQAMKVPSAFACAEQDPALHPALRNEAEAVFAARKDQPDFIDYEFVDYPGTAHGFAARPNLALPEIMEAYHKALEQTAAWFAKTLAPA